MAPPVEIESERAVLGAALTSAAARDAARDAGLLPAHLAAGEHQVLWAVLIDAADPTDIVGIARVMRASATLAKAGGASALGELVEAVPWISPERVREHTAIILASAQRRRVLETAHRIAAAGYDATRPAGEYVAAAVRQLEEAAGPIVQAGPTLLDGPAIAAELGPLDYLVPALGLVAGGGAPHLVAGYGYSGKTLALQAALLQFAAGRPVWGAYQCAPRRVIHVDLEQGERLSRRRYQRLAAAMDLDLAALGDRLALVVMPRGLTLDERCSEQWRALMVGRDVLVLDSLRAATPGGDENDSSIRSGLDMLGHLSEATGCRVIVIHHARKPSAGADAEPDPRMVVRGSSAIFDGCDGVYVLSGSRGEPVRVAHVKARSHGELVEDLALNIDDVAVDGIDRAGVRVAAVGAEAVDEAKDARAAAARAARAERDARVVLAAVRRSPGIGAVALRETVGMSGTRVAAALVALGGQVERRGTREGRGLRVGHWPVAGAVGEAGQTWGEN